jgi:hypothetical protein
MDTILFNAADGSRRLFIPLGKKWRSGKESGIATLEKSGSCQQCDV